MDRRAFLKTASWAAASLALTTPGFAKKRPQVAITMDDMFMRPAGNLTAEQRADRILSVAKAEHDVRIGIFSSGHNVDNPQGEEIMRRFDKAGHFLANHSYSHRNYHSPNVTFEAYSDDMWRNHQLMKSKGYRNFHPFYRFPMLREGDTAHKRDSMRAFLKDKKYRNGHVTIDNSDWYITMRMDQRLAKESNASLKPYRDYYVAHMLDRAKVYRETAHQVIDREIKHTLLLHFNSTTAYFLGDLIAALKKEGWEIIDAGDAFSDDIYQREPNVLPAGDSLVRAILRESGKKLADPRYPAEDGSYLKDEMDKLGL